MRIAAAKQWPLASKKLVTGGLPLLLGRGSGDFKWACDVLQHWCYFVPLMLFQKILLSCFPSGKQGICA